MDRHVVPVEELLPVDQVEPSPPESIQEHAQGSNDPAGHNFGFHMANSTLFEPLHLHGVWSPKCAWTLRFLVHSNDLAQDAPPHFLDQLNQGGQSLNPLVHQVL